uniref:LAGLIDADG homing endonuclease n=1 Tax=Globodera rostochiensis TaxID=31243 RepID=A0A914IDG8_GLORO
MRLPPRNNDHRPGLPRGLETRNVTMPINWCHSVPSSRVTLTTYLRWVSDHERGLLISLRVGNESGRQIVHTHFTGAANAISKIFRCSFVFIQLPAQERISWDIAEAIYSSPVALSKYWTPLMSYILATLTQIEDGRTASYPTQSSTRRIGTFFKIEFFKLSVQSTDLHLLKILCEEFFDYKCTIKNPVNRSISRQNLQLYHYYNSKNMFTCCLSTQVIITIVGICAQMASGYIHCVKFLLYHHMQKLVWRLENKWGVNFGNNYALNDKETGKENLALLEIYTKKKMIAWKTMLTIYNEKLVDLTKTNDLIRIKFDFCLIIEGETQLKCNAISTENAEMFVKYFHRIVYEPEFEQNRAKKAQLIGTNIFNSLRAERRKDEAKELKAGKDGEGVAKIAIKNWKLAEPSIRVRVQVLANVAERICQKLQRNPLKPIKKLGINIYETVGNMQNSDNVKGGGNDGTASDDDNNSDTENALEEISSDFVVCIYHYMYAFSQNLIGKIEKKSKNFDKKLGGIYKKLRGKTRKRLEVAFYADGVKELDKWLDSEKCSSSDRAAEAENDGAEMEDPFKNCANVTESHNVGEEDTVLIGEGGLLDKSFDEFLLPCASKFFAAVAGDQFEYALFVNVHTMQLDAKMEFPLTMKIDKTPTNGQHNARDQCFMMRELLISLNKNLAHRLNFQKITTRKEKERWTSLHQQYENLDLEKLDNNFLHRMGTKLALGYQSIERKLHKWNASGTLTHPIRDEYRKALEGTKQAMAKLGKAITKRRKKRTIGQKDDILSKKQQNRSGSSSGHLGGGDKQCKKEHKTLKDFLDEEHDIESLPTDTPQNAVKKIDKKLIEIRGEIENDALGKRLKVYQLFFRAFYIALALELFDRMENQGMTNWHFVLRTDEPQQKVSAKDKENVEMIKKQLQIFDEIVKRMGKKVSKSSSKNLKKSETIGNMPKTKSEDKAGGGGGLGEDENIGMGFELRFMGYTIENSGAELLESLQDEMKLNLDQFNMSFDAQCDLTNDLTDCFAASDGLDFAEQLEKFSLLGKGNDEMGTLQRAVESLFKKLNRWSYKFGQKRKRNGNLFKRFYFSNIETIVGGIPKLMTDQLSPFEIIIPFYLPIKDSINFVMKKVVVGPTETFRAWVVDLLARAELSINDKDEQFEAQKQKGEVQIKEIELSKIDPSIHFPNAPLSLNESLKPILQKMMAEEKEASTNKKKNLKTNKPLEKFKEFAKTLKDLFTNFVLQNGHKFIKVGDDEKAENSPAVANTKKRQRRRKRGITAGAGINAYIPAGKPGSSTIEALLIDAKLTETSLTTPLPGLQLHWIHFNHAVMLGKYNLAMSFVTCVLVLFAIASMLYWWHALKLAVHMAVMFVKLFLKQAMGTSSSSNTRKHGNFVKENLCSCCVSKLRAISFWKVEVDSMDRDVKRLANVGRGALATVVAAGSGVAAAFAVAFAGPVGIPVALMGAVTVDVVGDALAIKDDITHDCLEVLYKCDQCGHEVHFTYEITRHKSSRTAGRYSKRYSHPYTKRLYCSGTKMFMDVNRVFEGMWRDFHAVTKNCKKQFTFKKTMPPDVAIGESLKNSHQKFTEYQLSIPINGNQLFKLKLMRLTLSIFAYKESNEKINENSLSFAEVKADNDERNDCSICLETLNSEKLTMKLHESHNQNSQHIFHKDCIIKWIGAQGKIRCPLCNKETTFVTSTTFRAIFNGSTQMSLFMSINPMAKLVQIANGQTDDDDFKQIQAKSAIKKIAAFVNSSEQTFVYDRCSVS